MKTRISHNNGQNSKYNQAHKDFEQFLKEMPEKDEVEQKRLDYL